jgi:hypothetical protein
VIVGETACKEFIFFLEGIFEMDGASSLLIHPTADAINEWLAV